MKINFRQPKYVLPIIIVPFFCLFFYVWHSGMGKARQQVKQSSGLNATVGEVSSAVKKKQLAGKLDAFRNTFKEADGLSAVGVIPGAAAKNSSPPGAASDSAKRKLDSIRRALDKTFKKPEAARHERMLAAKLNQYAPGGRGNPPAHRADSEKDPMEMFKAQMAYMDSLGKANDPAFKAEKQKKEAAERLAAMKASEPRLAVAKVADQPEGFNTLMPRRDNGFINAVIDENLTGFAGSRLRLKLLDDLMAGNNLVKKGTYLYALVSGFSGQRVSLTITSILYGGKLLPVKLELYDLDGLPGFMSRRRLSGILQRTSAAIQSRGSRWTVVQRRKPVCYELGQ